MSDMSFFVSGFLPFLYLGISTIIPILNPSNPPTFLPAQLQRCHAEFQQAAGFSLRERPVRWEPEDNCHGTWRVTYCHIDFNLGIAFGKTMYSIICIYIYIHICIDRYACININMYMYIYIYIM